MRVVLASPSTVELKYWLSKVAILQSLNVPGAFESLVLVAPEFQVALPIIIPAIYVGLAVVPVYAMHWSNVIVILGSVPLPLPSYAIILSEASLSLAKSLPSLTKVPPGISDHVVLLRSKVPSPLRSVPSDKIPLSVIFKVVRFNRRVRSK